jgi:polyisoprenoid-binding protein YceI
MSDGADASTRGYLDDLCHPADRTADRRGSSSFRELPSESERDFTVCERHFWRVRAIVLCATLILLCNQSSAVEYTIDRDRTAVTFEMRSLGTLERGELTGAAGTVTLDPSGGSGLIEVVVDARTVETDSAWVRRFLRGPAVLNVEVYPKIVYQAQRMVFVDGALARIDGDLTLLGVTRPVPLAVTHDDCANQASRVEQRCAIVATGRFSRSAFGMTRYRILANDEVTLAIHAEGVRVRPEKPAT